MADENELLAAVEEGRRAARSSGQPERTFRDTVQPALATSLQQRGVRRAGRDEVNLTVPSSADAAALDAPLESKGRADAIYNRFVIEFEPPGALRPSLLHSATRHAVAQVQQYMRGMESQHGLQLERVAGCAFDGNWIVYVRWERGGWQVAAPVRVDTISLAALVDTLVSLASGRGLTAENLEEDFGRESETARLVVQALTGVLLDENPSSRTESMFEQWSLDLANASGPFSPGDLAAWRNLCDSLGVPSAERDSRAVLFSLQTYFSLVAKLLALVILEGATGQTLIPDLSRGVGREFFAALESGHATVPAGALNVIEPGIFSWYLYEESDSLTRGLEAMAATASEYSAEIVEVTPLVARDVLKDLFQRLLPRPIRHRLGEYYTPDWLAQRVINQVTGSDEALKPTTRVLDPSCGSGTFLVEVISRMIASASRDDPAGTLRSILSNVVGFDLSPLAVQASRVNYLLALAPLLRYADSPVHIPVFLADSVSLPRRGGLLEGDMLVLQSSEGEWRIPAELIERNQLPILEDLLLEALDQGQDEPWFAERLKARLQSAGLDRPQTIAVCLELLRRLKELDAADRDGMWWQLISNAFAPVLQRPFDFVVGNPPWVSWETLPEEYRRVNDDLWLQYRLRSDAPLGRRQASANVRLDLAMLFVAHCMRTYVIDGGRLGFLITATVFRTELGGRGFRGRHLPPSDDYSFQHIDDLSALNVFEDASNQTAILIARKGQTAGFLPVTLWIPRQSARIPTDIELERATELIVTRNLFAEPVDPTDELSPLCIMPRRALEATRSLRRASPYMERIREGVNTRGANGVFFVKVLGDEGNSLVRIRNAPAEGRDRALPVVEGTVERGALRRLLRGTDVSPGVVTPSLGLLFFHDDAHLASPLSPAEAERHFPLAYAYAQNFEERLRARRLFRNFDPSGDDWLGLYSVTNAVVAPHKVVVRDVTRGMIAAAVNDRDVVADHTLNIIECESEAEAQWLGRVLNSVLVRYVVQSFSVRIRVTGSFLRYIGIHDLSTLKEPEDEAESVATALGLSLNSYEDLHAVAESELSALP